MTLTRFIHGFIFGFSISSISGSSLRFFAHESDLAIVSVIKFRSSKLICGSPRSVRSERSEIDENDQYGRLLGIGLQLVFWFDLIVSNTPLKGLMLTTLQINLMLIDRLISGLTFLFVMLIDSNRQMALEQARANAAGELQTCTNCQRKTLSASLPKVLSCHAAYAVNTPARTFRAAH